MIRDKSNSTYKQILSTIGIIIATLIWGSSFIIMKNTMETTPPFFVLAARFMIAFFGLGIFAIKNLKKLTGKEVKHGVISGLLLWGVYGFQAYGLKYTSVTNTAFITNFYIVLVPLIHKFLFRRKMTKMSAFATLLASIGVLLLVYKGDLKLNHVGDLLIGICSILYAAYIVYLNWASDQTDAVTSTVLQLLVVNLICIVCTIAFEEPVNIFLLSKTYILSILYMGILGTLICFLLLNLCEEYLSVSTVSILLTLETVFGVIFAVLFLGEELFIKDILGCILILLSIVAVNIQSDQKKEEA